MGLTRAANYLALVDELNVTVPPGVRETFSIARVADDVLRALTTHAVALHCDLIPGNFIKGAQLWIFDFEYCHFGDAAWDIANIITFNSLEREGEVSTLLQAYGLQMDDLLSAKL